MKLSGKLFTKKALEFNMRSNEVTSFKLLGQRKFQFFVRIIKERLKPPIKGFQWKTEVNNKPDTDLDRANHYIHKR